MSFDGNHRYGGGSIQYFEQKYDLAILKTIKCKMSTSRCSIALCSVISNKVQLFWEGHKNLCNLPHGFDVY